MRTILGSLCEGQLGPLSETGSAAFLQQSHRNNWQQCLASLKPDATGVWDRCVLMAGDERQADVYHRQLALRREVGLLPPRTCFLTLADPAGQQIGSGGATGMCRLCTICPQHWQCAPGTPAAVWSRSIPESGVVIWGPDR
jgi:hypothetical protein